MSLQVLGESVDHADPGGGRGSNSLFHQTFGVTEEAVDTDALNLMQLNLIGYKIANVVLIEVGTHVVREFTLVEVYSASLTLPNGNILESMLRSETNDSHVVPLDDQSGFTSVVRMAGQVISFVERGKFALLKLGVVGAPKPR